MTMPPDTDRETPLRLLRGRVMIRPIVERVTSAGLVIPDPTRRTNERSLGKGVVAMVGPPAYTQKGGAIVPQEFKVGDTVLYVGQHVSRKIVWNGEEVAMVSQEEVQAVVEPEYASTVAGLCMCCHLPFDRPSSTCVNRHEHAE